MKDPQFSTNQQKQHSNCTRQLPPSQEQIPTRKVPINEKRSRTTNYRNKNSEKHNQRNWITTQTKRQRTKGNYTNAMEVIETAIQFPHIF